MARRHAARRIGWMVGLAAMAAGTGLTPAASAAPRPGGADFSCRASAVRVQLVGQTLLEPTVANPGDAPCADGAASIIAPTAIGPVNIDVANANTAIDPDNLAAAPAVDGDNGRAFASVTNPVVDVGGVRLTAGVLGATSSYTCRAGQPVAAGSSVVADVLLTVAGQAVPITLPAGNAPFTLELPGGLGTLLLNQQTVTNGRITQRALELRLPANSAIANVVIGDATVALTGNPCAAAAVTPPATLPQCSDARDNDGDGLIDARDPGCLSGPGGTFNPADNDETNAAAPQCSDGVDNDGDGRTDFPSDRGCSSRTDTTERTPTGTSTLTSSPSRIARQGLSGQCVRGSFTARVTGRSISSVRFSLDGRTVRTDSTAPYTSRISTSRAGAHRVTARVTFVGDSRTSTRNLSFRYRRCAAAATGPRFTG